MTTSKFNTRDNHAELLKPCPWTLFESIGRLPKSTDSIPPEQYTLEVAPYKFARLSPHRENHS